MRRRHPRLLAWLEAIFTRSPETSRLIVGSTGSGKSEGELVDLVRLAGRRDYAVVLLDGHGPLAFRAAGHWAARGHEPRIVYEPLDATDRVLCWNMLPKSAAASPRQRAIEDAETRDEVAQCFLSQRNLTTLVDRPWTKEWLEAAIELCLAQPEAEPLTSLLDAFSVGSPDYERLVTNCDRPEIIAKFRGMELLRRRNLVQYDIETGPARRLVELVCNSEVARLRSRPGPFDWLDAIRRRRLVVFDGGSIRSRELKRTMFLLAGLQVTLAVRRHFAATQTPLPVVLVLEEAGSLGLLTPFVRLAMQELRKAGLAVHVITQSAVDFGDADLFQAVLSYTPWQAWYQCLSPADQEIGAKALANATFDSFEVHFTRLRALPGGTERVESQSRGVVIDPKTHTTIRRDWRTGTVLATHYRHNKEASYKTPQLHEQEYRTKLATLRIGERLVRDRRRVWKERVRRVRMPLGKDLSDAATRALIGRLREQPIFQPCPPADQNDAKAVNVDAAQRLREACHS